MEISTWKWLACVVPLSSQIVDQGGLKIMPPSQQLINHEDIVSNVSREVVTTSTCHVESVIGGHFAACPCRDGAEYVGVDVLIDKSNATITKQQVNSANMRTTEVVDMK